MRGYIPTPSVSSLEIGTLTIHFYAFCILIGILTAIYIARLRLPGKVDLINELAVYVIPAGVVGARIYHVITTPEKYFNSNFLDALKIWQGGLGIWGAISGGALAAYIYLRSKGMQSEFFVIADALAPGLVFAQALGRFGNWFNGELFGKPTTLPWALEIPFGNRPEAFSSFETFHPTFLYEAIWCIAVGLILLKVVPKQSGQVFWLYVSLYSLGRALIELIRIDYSNLILGVRLNVWIALICATLGAWQYLKSSSKKIG